MIKKGRIREREEWKMEAQILKEYNKNKVTNKRKDHEREKE
jgi:hypothetical protein